MKRNFFPLLVSICMMSFFSYADEAAQIPLIAEKLQVEVEVLSWSPRIIIYRHFLSDEECDYLINESKPFLTPSTVVDYTLPNGRKIDNRRSSEGMAFPKYHFDPILGNIEQRISLLTLIPPENGENIQILHYHTGGEYQPHYDYFNGNTVGGASYLSRGGQRVASFLMYLNTPEGGGETIFPKVDIKVKPVKGDALLFFDCNVDGKEDPLTFHGGSPVLVGEKWLATRWLRQYLFE